MIRIVDILPVQRKAYKDIIISGKDVGEKDAPVLAFYKVHLRADDGRTYLFDAEIRTTPRGLQADWYEDLDDFLFGLTTPEKANLLRKDIAMAIYATHENHSHT